MTLVKIVNTEKQDWFTQPHFWPKISKPENSEIHLTLDPGNLPPKYEQGDACYFHPLYIIISCEGRLISSLLIALVVAVSINPRGRSFVPCATPACPEFVEPTGRRLCGVWAPLPLPGWLRLSSVCSEPTLRVNRLLTQCLTSDPRILAAQTSGLLNESSSLFE